MCKHLMALAFIGLASHTVSAASEGEKQAQAFAHHYASLCLKHLNNLDALRDKLKPIAQLRPEQAAHFLAGRAGDAWPIPEKSGLFVLALPAGKNMCAVHARRADTVAAQKQFSHLVARAPAPLVARQVRNQKAQTAANGETQTVAYEWSMPNEGHKVLFTLTTAASTKAQLQVLGSVAIISP